MRKNIINNLVARWAASLLSVVILLSMGAAPVIAVSAGWVTSTDIKDGTILTRDIKRNAVNSSRIKDYSIRKEDIHSASINKYKLTSNSVNTYKIEDGSVKTQDIANDAVSSAKIADGAVGSADIDDGSITNADISKFANISDDKISYDTTKTGYLSIPAAALEPISPGYSYNNQGRYLYFVSGSGVFLAPVNLPHGAIVKKLTLATYDDHAEDTEALLYRVNDTGGMEQMAQAYSVDSSASWRSFSDESVSQSTVDNSAYSYHIQVGIYGAGTDLMAGNIRITYEYLSLGS